MEKKIKRCRACLKYKSIEDFGVNNSIKDGRQSKCKPCFKSKRATNEEFFFTGEIQLCLVCNIEKDLYYFDRRLERGGVYNKRCRECADKRITIQDVKYNNKGEKRCTVCLDFKPVKDYSTHSTSPDGLYSSCKKCSNIRAKKYRDSLTKEERRKIKRQDYEKYKEGYKRRAREWAKNNREKYLESLRESNKRRYGKDNLYTLKIQISSLIRGRLKSKKKHKTFDILGCTIHEFKKYIESQFENWMDWDNHGLCEDIDYKCTWQLDHIIPITYAKTEEEIYLLNHYSNFQPLCGKKNIEKSNSVPLVSNIELKITTLK